MRELTRLQANNVRGSALSATFVPAQRTFDSRVILRHKVIVHELDRQRRLANAYSSDKSVLDTT